MNDDFFIKKIKDVLRLSEKYHCPKFSKFLDEREQAMLKKEGVSNGILFGGYADAERKVFGVFPEWNEPELSEFPITALRITKKYDKELNHRNYLGTILSLGIERDKVGDILTDTEGATVFVLEDISEFIRDNIKKVAGCGVRITVQDKNSIIIPDKNFELIEIVTASMRLDACLGAILKVSRKTAKELALSGNVSVNHMEVKSEDVKLSEGDLLSIRGFGRAEIMVIGGKTRSDRVHVTVKKYI